MTDITPGAAPAPSDKLHAELRTEVLGGERAQYGSQLLDQLGRQLSQKFGRGFEARNLRRMVQFAQAFPQPEIVATLSRQSRAGATWWLSWPSKPLKHSR